MIGWPMARESPRAAAQQLDVGERDRPETVLLVAPSWSRAGGIAAHVVASARALAAHGASVEVLVAEASDEESAEGVSVHVDPVLGDANAPAARRLRAIADLAPDVAHFHEIEDAGLVGELRRLAPVAVSVHGYSACTSHLYYFRPGQECTRAHGPGCIPNLLLRGCAHTFDPRPLPRSYQRVAGSLQALRAADIAISYSSSVDRHLAANAISPRRVVPLFTTVAPAAAEGHEARRKVVAAGRAVAAKGFDTLIRAAALVQAEFVICGEGWQLPELRKLAAREGVADRVAFPGWLPPEELARELAEASVVVVPSLWPEPFGIVGIEALAAGRPVVASATGGIEDWLRADVSGLLFRPGDHRDLARGLGELLDDPERQARMGQAGALDVAERFTPQRHVEALMGAYAGAREAWDGRG